MNIKKIVTAFQVLNRKVLAIVKTHMSHLCPCLHIGNNFGVRKSGEWSPGCTLDLAVLVQFLFFLTFSVMIWQEASANFQKCANFLFTKFSNFIAVEHF